MVMVQKLSYLTNLTYVETVLMFFTEKKINIKIKTTTTTTTTTTRNLAEGIPVTLLTYICKVPGSNISKDLTEVCRNFCSLSWYSAMR